jgi:chemotaxis signal transduction protein
MITTIIITDTSMGDENRTHQATTATTTRVLVHSYSHEKKTFLVRKVSLSSSYKAEDQDQHDNAISSTLAKYTTSQIPLSDDDDDELLEVDVQNVQPAPSAKFYPVLEVRVW